MSAHDSQKMTPEQMAYAEREKRINDVIALRTPDRMPITSLFSFFPARYKGITVREAMYEPEKMFKVWEETFLEFKPDLVENPFPMRQLGKLLEVLDFKMLKWAGHGLDDNAAYQFVDEEYMKADEYDEFLFDPTDYMMHKFWPRVFGALDPLKKLPHFHDVICYYFGTFTAASLFTDEMMGLALILKQASDVTNVVLSNAGKFAQTMAAHGFPGLAGSATQVPFDTLGDFFRGTKGLMLDMRRRPDKVLAAVDKLLPIMIRIGVEGAKRTGNPRVFIPLHKGVESFMSDKQYQTFYWPGFKALMDALIDEGLYPCPLVEGEYNARLKYLAQVPAGKVCYHFENLDYRLVREHLGGIACIRGGMPIRILSTGTPQDVTDFMKKFTKDVGDSAGFIFDVSTVLDEAKPDNLRAMYDFVLNQ